MLFESMLISADGEELVWKLILIVVLVSPFGRSIVFDTTSELAVKELTIKLGLIVLCVNPLKICHFTGV